MDVFDNKKRSWIMSRIKNKDTQPEIQIRSIVHRLGFRFCKNRKNLPGKPDIVLPKYKKVIFVHGCFWHGHKKCNRASRPSSNEAFWHKKLETNILRDKRNIKELKGQNYQSLIIWQCQIKKEKRLFNRIKHFLDIK